MEIDTEISKSTVKIKKQFYQIGIIAAACFLYAVSAGIRSIYGIMLGTISLETGIPYAAVSLAIAVGQFVFGLAQPVFGIIAIKKSNLFVLVIGGLMIALGLAAIPLCTDERALILFLGVLLPIGSGAVSFGMIMSAVSAALDEKKAAAASGFINASSGAGSILLSPTIQWAFSAAGFQKTMLFTAMLALLILPFSIIVTKAGNVKKAAKEKKASGIMPLIQKSLCDKSYRCLLIGFFTCGFHMAIIETHLFSQMVSCGIAENIAAMAFSIYGFSSVAGSLASGFFCSKVKMKWVVSALYGSRAVWIGLFLLLPKNIPTFIAFSSVLGLTGASTVTPTSGIVGKLFGAESIATLFGIVFVSHQTGSFFSAWLGGICAEATGSYIPIWCIGALLSVAAMFVSCLIKEPE